MQKTSLAPAAPHHGALWLEEEVEAVRPPWWLPQQGNTLFVKEIECPDAWKAKEDAHWVAIVRDELR